MSLALTQLIPMSELSLGSAATIRNEAIKRIVSIASQQLNLAQDKLVVRDIRAKDDLNFTYEDYSETTGSTANAYETMDTGTLADQRYMGIYGVKITANCAVTALKFTVGGGDRAIWQLQSLNEEDGYVGFTPSVILIPQNTPYTIHRFVRLASNVANVAIKGFVVEPRGKVISP